MTEFSHSKFNPARPIIAAVRSFMPSSMPFLSRSLYAREFPAWALLPVMTGVLEGGVVGIIVKKLYEGVVADELLSIIIAVLTGLQAIANVLSFAWAALNYGRHKIRMLVTLQVACALLVTLPAFAGEDTWGLGIFVFGVVAARLCWSGVVTLRSAIWAANFPRAVRARMAGKFATIQALVLAGVSAIVGILMDWDHNIYRWIYPLAAVIGLLGTLLYSRIRMRGHRALLRQEQHASEDSDSTRPSMNPMRILSLLRNDTHFMKFMLCQFLLGTGNMMITAPLIIVLTSTYGMDYVESIAIMTTIPILMMPFFIPLWSRFLDRVHIIKFRAVHSWFFVAATLILALSVSTGWLAGLWVVAVVRGIAFGGGMLAWNLGHHDFADMASSSAYMGVHVTLTGIRGLFAPLLGVVLYELMKGVNPTGWIVFLIALMFVGAGAVGFVLLARSLPERADFNLAS